MGKRKGRKMNAKRNSKSAIATFFRAQTQDLSKDDLYRVQDVIEDRIAELDVKEMDEEEIEERAVYASLFAILKEKMIELKKIMKDKSMLVVYTDGCRDIIDRIDITDTKRKKVIQIDSEYGEAEQYFDGIDGEGFEDNERDGKKEIEKFMKRFRIYEG